MALTSTCRRHGVLGGVLPAAILLLCLGLRPGATAPVEDACPCLDPSHCELITAPPRKEVFAFVVNDANWKKYDWSKITTIGLYTKYDPELMCYAHSKGARIVRAAANLSSHADRTAWIQQQVAQAKSWHMDGINFDIEYQVSPEYTHYLDDLVKETAQSFRAYNPHAQISFDIPWISYCLLYNHCYDNYALAQSCDFLFVMDYDIGDGGPVAIANSPLFAIKLGIDALRLQGIPDDKLVIGVPWYGYDYPCLDVLPGNICLPNGTRNSLSNGVGSGKVSQVDYKYINKLLPKSSTGRLFSKIFESPYFNYKDASGQTHQVWYDDPSSLAMRYAYAKAENLRGVGMWHADSLDYSDDPTAKKQTKAMWDAIDKF